MTKLHELLAAEKTPTGAWNQLAEDTLKKFKNPTGFFEGHSKSLKMLSEDNANKALEDAAKEEKPVVTNVYDTLEYALGIFGKAEDVQYQKNATNRLATADVLFRGVPLLTGLPVDELLGLEARLVKIRQIYSDIPTLDATKHWKRNNQFGAYVWETEYPEETTKTEKTMTPVIMVAATDKHPAQVEKVNKDIVVGKYTTIKRTGAATAIQKAEAIKVVDELIIEVKQARMRANETVAVSGIVSAQLIEVLLAPLKN